MCIYIYMYLWKCCMKPTIQNRDMHEFKHACIHACMHACMYAYTSVELHIHRHTIWAYKHAYTYIHIHTYTYTHTHIHTYTYTHTHIHTQVQKLEHAISYLDDHLPHTRLVALENSHSGRGGVALPESYVDSVASMCKTNNLWLHGETMDACTFACIH